MIEIRFIFSLIDKISDRALLLGQAPHVFVKHTGSQSPKLAKVCSMITVAKATVNHRFASFHIPDTRKRTDECQRRTVFYKKKNPGERKNAGSNNIFFKKKMGNEDQLTGARPPRPH
jgi:hypothetical protein